MKASDYPPGAIRVYVNGVLIGEGRTKVAIGQGESDPAPWVSITTDPDDLSYLTVATKERTP